MGRSETLDDAPQKPADHEAAPVEMPGRAWTSREIALVEEAARLNRDVGQLRGDARLRDVARKTGRTYAAVQHKASRLRVVSNTGEGRRPRCWIGPLGRHARVGEPVTLTENTIGAVGLPAGGIQPPAQ